MFTIRDAYRDDFEKVYPFLHELNSTDLTKEEWRLLFTPRKGSSEEYFGHILLDDGRIIGFIALIFSKRVIDGNPRKFANMTSWIISRDYRGKGLGKMMLEHIAALKDYTVTDLSAAPDTLRMLEKYGFRLLETGYIAVPPVPGIGYLTGMCRLAYVDEEIAGRMDEENRKIYNDHKPCKCVHIAAETKDGLCYLILTRTKRKGLPFAEIHYISDLPLFMKHIQYLRVKLCLQLKVFGLAIDKRFLKGGKIKFSLEIGLPPVKYFRSDTLDSSRITDHLYTETLIIAH